MAGKQDAGNLIVKESKKYPKYNKLQKKKTTKTTKNNSQIPLHKHFFPNDLNMKYTR